MTFKVTIFAAAAVQSLQGPAEKQGDLRIVAGQTLHKEQLAYTDSDNVVIVSAPISFSFDADVVKHNVETGAYNIVDVDGKKITFNPNRGLSITIQELAEAEEEEEPAPKAKAKKKVVEEEEEEEAADDEDDIPTTKRGPAAKKAAAKKKVVEDDDEEEDTPPPKKKKAAVVEEEEEEPAPKAKKKKAVETDDEDFNWED